MLGVRAQVSTAYLVPGNVRLRVAKPV